MVSAFVYKAGCELLLVLHIDDPLNAAPVHLPPGMWGLIALSLFAPQVSVSKIFFIGKKLIQTL